MDSDTRKIIFLATVAIILLVVVLFFVFQESNQEPADEYYAAFPESSSLNDAENLEPVVVYDLEFEPVTSPEPILTEAQSGINSAVVAQNSDWRDSVIVVGEGSVASETSQVDQTTTPSDISAYSRESLVAEGILYDYPVQVIDPIYTNQEAFIDSLEIFAQLDSATKKVIDCGAVKIPSSESAVEKFFSQIDEEEAVICMGEAVADGCEMAQAEYNATADHQSIVYVATRKDGLCGVGASNVSGFVNLCSVASIMESTTGINKTAAEWQSQFGEEPGETFASIFQGQVSGVTSKMSFDCVMHQL